MYDGTNFVRVDPDGITQAAADLRYLQITAAASTYLALSGGTLTGDLTLTGAPTTNNMAATKKYVDDEIAAIPSSDSVPAGTVIWTARSSAPTGYLKANGAAVSRTTYATLFSAIGTQFGAGDGSTTFNLPDLRGEFVRGLDDGRGIDAGRTLGSTQADQNKQHNHGGTTSTASLTGTFTPGTHATNTTGVFSDGGNVGSPETGDSNNGRRVDLDVSHSHTISNDGGTESRPRNVALLGCIKT
jgi:microcystin-dependent protein